MKTINRREFLGLGAVAAAGVAGQVFGETATTTSAPVIRRALSARDTVVLGKTGIKASRLAIGTGSKGGSVQRALGSEGMIKLLRHGFDEGIRWWDAADTYKSHPYVGEAIGQVPRDKLVITSKVWSHTRDHACRPPQDIRADIERFRRELKTDYIDVCLLHCLTDPAWREKMKPAMEVLSEAKQKGQIRAVGCSCHTIEALKAASEEPWIEVILARFNPYAVLMDVEKQDEVLQVAAVLEAAHRRGKAIYGMKIVGEGAFKGDQINESLRFALSKPFIDAFTIGFANQGELDDMIKRIQRVSSWA
jgi:aryl-alcohol dehydrogenase-like predicted oxidoreductase